MDPESTFVPLLDGMAMKRVVFLGAVALGFLLLILSGLWPMLFPGTSTWTEEKAARWSEVKDRIHNLGSVVSDPRTAGSMHRGADPGPLMQEFEQLKKEGDLLKADFQSAYDTPRTASAILKWTGIGLACLGIVGWLAVRDS